VTFVLIGIAIALIGVLLTDYGQRRG